MLQGHVAGVCYGGMLRGYGPSCALYGRRYLLKAYGIMNNAFLLVYFCFVAGSVCKSSAHDATLKMRVVLSPLLDAQIQTC